MKKIAKILAVILIVGAIACSFASCSNTLNGTYVSTGDVGSALNGKLTFDRDNNVSGEITAPIIGTVSVDGKYVIEDDQITFTYTVFGVNKDITYSIAKDGKVLFIDHTAFVKEETK